MKTQNETATPTTKPEANAEKTFYFEDLEKDFPDIRITREVDIHGKEYVSKIKLPLKEESPYRYKGSIRNGTNNEKITSYSFSKGRKIYTYTAKPIKTSCSN